MACYTKGQLIPCLPARCHLLHSLGPDHGHDRPRFRQRSDREVRNSRLPFVIAFDKAGIKVLPSIINAVILTSAFSSGNSCTFLASRTLFGLALEGFAPRVFLWVNRWGVPYVCVGFCSLFGALAYLALGTTSLQAFLWLVNLVTTAGLIAWCVICITFIRFHVSTHSRLLIQISVDPSQRGIRVQGISRTRLPYKAPLQPYLTWVALVMISLILLFCGFSAFTPSFDYGVCITLRPPACPCAEIVLQPSLPTIPSCACAGYHAEICRSELLDKLPQRPGLHPSMDHCQSLW